MSNGGVDVVPHSFVAGTGFGWVGFRGCACERVSVVQPHDKVPQPAEIRQSAEKQSLDMCELQRAAGEAHLATLCNRSAWQSLVTVDMQAKSRVQRRCRLCAQLQSYCSAWLLVL
jgi:hypothetical protein